MPDEQAKLLSIVNSSALGEEEKARWRKCLPFLPDFAAADLLEALEHDPKLISWLTENWDMKERLKKEGQGGDAILAEEARQIEQLFSSENNH